MLQNFWHDEQGASMTEYVLLVALVGMAAFVLIKNFGQSIKDLFETGTGLIEDAEGEMGN